MSAVRKTRTDSAEKRRALVVDDSHDSAQTMVWTLEALGYEATIAHDGLSAVDIGHSFKPHIVLLDINMPGMNGYEICELMRHDPEFKSAIFVAQTGWGQEEHRQRSQAAGFHHHLVKPIKLEDLKRIFDGAGEAP